MHNIKRISVSDHPYTSYYVAYNRTANCVSFQGFLLAYLSLQDSIHLVFFLAHSIAAFVELVTSFHGHMLSLAKQSRKTYSQSSWHSSKSKLPFFRRLFLPPSIAVIHNKATNSNCWKMTIVNNGQWHHVVYTLRHSKRRSVNGCSLTDCNNRLLTNARRLCNQHDVCQVSKIYHNTYSSGQVPVMQ